MRGAIIIIVADADPEVQGEPRHEERQQGGARPGHDRPHQHPATHDAGRGTNIFRDRKYFLKYISRSKYFLEGSKYFLAES